MTSMAQRIYDALTAFGPMSTREIDAATGIKSRHAAVVCLRAKGKSFELIGAKRDAYGNRCFIWKAITGKRPTCSGPGRPKHARTSKAKVIVEADRIERQLQQIEARKRAERGWAVRS